MLAGPSVICRGASEMVPALNAEVIVSVLAPWHVCMLACWLSGVRAAWHQHYIQRRPWMGGAGILQTKIFQTFRYFRYVGIQPSEEMSELLSP